MTACTEHVYIAYKHVSKDLNGSCRNLYMREVIFGGTCCPNHGQQYRELLQAITWFAGKVDADVIATRVCTSDHRTCYQNLSRQRPWKAETVLWKQFVTCFSIAKSILVPSDTQKLPKGAPGSLRPNPSLEWRTSLLRQCQCLETSTWGGPAWP